MSRSGVITLTTDFGHKGPFVATMKGVLHSRFAGANVIDLTHEIMVHWPAEAGFWLERSYKYFPQGTVHLAVVDPGVGTSREIIVVEHDGHLFVAPDNGLLTPMIEASKNAKVVALNDKGLAKLGVKDPSATFHGRDIFAPLAAELAAGRLKLSDIGSPHSDLVPSWVDAPTRSATQIDGTVIAVDNFGNLITNIDAEWLTESVDVSVAGHTVPFHRTYGDAKPGDYLALVNSFGVIEIARSEQSAADGLGAERGAPVKVKLNG